MATTGNRHPTGAPFQSRQSQPTGTVAEPIRNSKKLFGVLHEKDGTAVQRTVRTLKVGFGLPVGKDLHVFINKQGIWTIHRGVLDEKGKRTVKVYSFNTKMEAVQAYIEIRKSAIDRKYPTKFPYFTFSRMGIDGEYLPDFDAIEKHGPVPSEISITALIDEPFEAQFEAWTKANLKCKGDGKVAERRIDWAHNDAEKKLAATAKGKGLDWFTIVGCFTGGCPFPKGDKPACKPHGRLYFQLTESPRIGGSCTYDTTGFRSISQIYSSIQQIKTMTGNGDPERGFMAGIPLMMVLRPYRVTHNGQPSIQFGVSLEFRANNAVDLARLLNKHAQDFKLASRAEPLQIAAPVTLDEGEDVSPEELAEATEVLDAEDVTGEQQQVAQTDVPLTEAQEAKAMTGEFYSDESGWGDLADLSEELSRVQIDGENPIEVEDSDSGNIPTEASTTELLPLETFGPFVGPKRPAPSQVAHLLELFVKNGHGKTAAQLSQRLATWKGSLDELVLTFEQPPAAK